MSRTRSTLLAAIGLLLSAAIAAWATGEKPQPKIQTTPLRLGINLAGNAYWSTEHPFSNLVKHGSRWRTQRIGQAFTWDDPLPELTPEGYPRRIPADSVLEVFILGTPHRAHLSDELVVLYDGKGRLEYSLGARLKSRAPGRDVIEDVGGEYLVAQLVETDSQDPVRNIRVYEASAEQSPTTFRRTFLDRWAGMSTLRFMDWMETNNSQVRSWAQRPRPDNFTQTGSGIALEYMIALANTQKGAPWFCMPHLADDDYVRRFARQVKQDLDPSLPIYVEYSNEVWNSQFEQARYAAARGQELKLSSNPFEAQLRFYAQRSTEVFRIWEEVFADQKDRVIAVLSTQAANPWTSTVVLEWKDASRHADVLAVAPYFGGSLGDPEVEQKVAGWSLDQLFAALRTEVARDNRKMITGQAEIARQFGLKLVAYEGGQHLVGHGGSENNPKIEKLFQTANRDARMEQLYLEHLGNWQAAGGDVYVMFSSVAPYSKWGSWGILETESQDPATSPKWRALRKALQQAASTPPAPTR